MKILDTYKGFFRRIRFAYALNNLLNRRHLRHNKKNIPAFWTAETHLSQHSAR